MKKGSSLASELKLVICSHLWRIPHILASKLLRCLIIPTFPFFFQGDALQNDLSVGQSLSILSTEALRRENHKKT